MALAQHRKNAAFKLGHIIALDLEIGLVRAPVVGVVDASGPGVRTGRRESVDNLKADQWTYAFGRIGMSLSVFGLPVSRSIGRASQATVPQSLLAWQVDMRTLVPPSSDIQTPSGAPASAAPGNRQNPIAARIELFIFRNFRFANTRWEKTQCKHDRLMAR
jgi:hypothetical protein